ncbi:MAG: TetR/AcrR family transcriptional regulator [Verrucomicrobiota bacterium]
MSKTLLQPDSDTRQLILHAALRSFAERGYVATSVQRIVSEAKVSKPTLYYYFRDKAGLFQALVDHAHEERYRLMREAAERGGTISEKLEEIVVALFEFSVRNQELMRLAFATAFTGSTDTPGHAHCLQKGRRNYEWVRGLMAEAQRSGEIGVHYDLDTLTMGIYGQLNMYVMVRLLMPECALDRQTAARIVDLFLAGAASGSGGRGGCSGTRQVAGE